MASQRLTPDQKEYIRVNASTLTDEEVAKHLACSTTTVSKIRKRFGIFKGESGKNKRQNLFASHILTDEQRKEFFKTQLANSIFYTNLKQQFTKEELDFYLEEWGSLCVQFEDIVATEKRQIDEMIKAEILGNRLLRSIKVANDNVILLNKEIEKFRKQHPEIKDDETLQERDNQLMELSRSLSMQAEYISQNYAKNVDNKNKILGELNGRRKDRIDQIKKGNTTFIGLVENFRNQQVREKEGKYMELVKIAKDRKREQWRKSIIYPDGNSDSILLDDKTNIKEQDLVQEEEKSYMISKYSQLAEKKILILDSHGERSKFFNRKFKNHKVDFAGAAEKFSDFTIYNFICLNDTLKSGKVMDIIDKILLDDICKNTDFLVHSENEEFNKQVLTKLAGKRKVELCYYKDFYSV